MRAFALILKTLWSPGSAFREIRESRTGPWIPFLVFIAIGVSSTYLLTSRIDFGEALMREVLRGPQAGDMSLDDMNALRETFNNPYVTAGLYMASLWWVGVSLPVATLYYLIFLMVGSRAGFMRFWSVTAFAFTPILVAGVAGLGVMYTIPPSAFSLGQMNVLSAAVFMDPQAESGALYALAQATSLTTIWILALLTIGYGVLTPKRIGAATRAVIVVIPWLFVVATRVLPALIF